MKKTVSLCATVLASTLFVIPQGFSAPISSVYAEPVPNPQLTSSINPDLTITPTGQLNATAIDGFQINTQGASVIIEANNVNAGNNAIIATDPGNGINILNGGGANSGATIVINSGSAITITGGGAGILIGDDTATLTNAGTINGGGNAIEISAGGTNATIVNSGIFQGGSNGAGVLVDGFVANGGSGLSLTNQSGALIAATGNADAVQVNQNFNTITNEAGGIFSSVNGNGINLGSSAVSAITGQVNNSGTITMSGTLGNGLLVAGVFNGIINNNSGGIIEATNTSSLAYAVWLINSFGAFNNYGIIQTTAPTGQAIPLYINNAAGTFTNTGIIQSLGTAATIYFNGSTTEINNMGTIKGGPTGAHVGEGVIFASNNAVTIINGIVNSGNITSTSAAAAINLSNAGSPLPLIQNGGIITGDVLLAGGGGTVLTMTNGIINGDVLSSATNASILNLNGGIISGETQLGNVAGNIVNLAGTSLQDLIGGNNTDTFNLSGGSFASLDGNNGADVINVTGAFIQDGTITQIPTINVLKNGTFTVNNSISADTTAFNIKAGGLMVTNFNNLNTPGANISISSSGGLKINNGSDFTALSATNNGNITLNGGILNLNGNYIQNPTGSLSPVIYSIGDFGQLNVTGTATFVPGATMQPSLNTNGNFVPAGTQFQVVTALGGVAGTPTLVQPQSALVFFTQTVNPNDITLTLQLNPVSAVAQGDIPQAVGSALDVILFGGTNNPELLAILGQLQLFPDSTSLSNALLQLAPPFNYALPTSTRIVMDHAFDSVQIRLEQLHGLGPAITEENYREHRDYELYNGVNYGDLNIVEFGINHFNAWAKVDGTIIDQHKRNEIEGFLAESSGIALGWDFRLTTEALIGVSANYTKVNTTDNTSSRNEVNLQSYQATFYGWFEPVDALYFDTMLGVASHKYDTLRNIQFGTFTAAASAEFLGIQYGAQTDVGYAFLNEENWYLAPYARFRYTHLELDQYDEEGAGGVGLIVENQPLDELIGGIGLRVAAKKDYITAVYIPEATATLLYDFAGAVQEMQSTFIGFTAPFYVNSIKPAQLIQLYSFGISAYTTDGYCFTAKVNFEYRNELFGYNGYFQLNYMWD
ncbi:MAG: autotransporter domain-containing protein [Proteobacteria bacterium]|nr:autotransporter domain-containing protein [Pseudomonadota bacterium]